MQIQFLYKVIAFENYTKKPINRLMKKRITLTAFMQEIINQFQQEERFGTAHVYRSTLRRIKNFIGDSEMTPDEITPLWLKAFQNHLCSEGLQWNSISTYMRMLRAVYFRAVDCGLATYRARLFKSVYTGTRSTVKRAVGTEVLQQLSAPLPEKLGKLDSSRMLFLLLFMLRGIPFVDLVFLRKCDYRDGIISYRRKKTGTRLTVKVEPAAQRLIELLKTDDADSEYLFPYINPRLENSYRQYQNALRTFNRNLQILSYELRFDKLSSYTARHSWATIAHHCKFQLGLISNAMGHSSERVTETYLKPYEKDEIDEMNKGVISYVFT